MLAMILKRPYCTTYHQELPLHKEREAFLKHLHNQGTSRAALRGNCWQMMNVMKHLQLKRMRAVSLEELKEAAERWAMQQRSNSRARSYENSAGYFTCVVKKWLRFAGKLEQPKAPPMRYADRVEDFAQWLRDEEGLSEMSVQSYSWKAKWFLKWLSGEPRGLCGVRISDVDRFLVFKAGMAGPGDRLPSAPSRCACSSDMRSGTKQRIDHHRLMWVTAEMMTDLYNHDLYSRQVAEVRFRSTTTISSAVIVQSKQPNMGRLFQAKNQMSSN